MACQPFADWSKQRMAEWKHIESYHSPMGMVERGLDGGWIGKVMVGDKLYRVKETFESAPVAMKAVERTYDRESKRRT